MSSPGGTTIVMLSGARVDLLAPDWREIQLTDVAYGLAAIRRWNGQARRPISDIDHSFRVADLCAPRWRLAALLHDGQEYAFGDWIVPAVNALSEFPGVGPVEYAIDEIKFRLDVAIGRRVLASFGPASYGQGDSEELEAIRIAHEMRSPEVRRADQEAADLEDRGRGVLGHPNPIELPRALHDVSAANAWIERVQQACADRYGAGHAA